MAERKRIIVNPSQVVSVRKVEEYCVITTTVGVFRAEMEGTTKKEAMKAINSRRAERDESRVPLDKLFKLTFRI